MKKDLWRELIEEARIGCGGNKDEMIGWLAGKLASALTEVCAWCPDKAEQEANAKGPVTHGICSRCSRLFFGPETQVFPDRGIDKNQNNQRETMNNTPEKPKPSYGYFAKWWEGQADKTHCKNFARRCWNAAIEAAMEAVK